MTETTKTDADLVEDIHLAMASLKDAIGEARKRGLIVFVECVFQHEKETIVGGYRDIVSDTEPVIDVFRTVFRRVK